MQVSMQACRSFLRATYTNDAPGTEGKPVAVDVRGPVSEVPAIPGSTTIAEPLSTGGRPVTVDARGPVAEASEAAAGQEAGTVHNSRARITPELCTGSVGRPGWSKGIYRHRIPLAVVGTPLATRKGLRETLLAARRLRWEQLSGPFEPQRRHGQRQP